MIWIDNINQLQYYNQPKGVPCYCDIIAYPADLTLQGAFNAGSGSYTIVIEIIKADGTVVFETVTSYFEYYFAKNSFTGQHFFNARLKAFAVSMCTHACYILHVTVMDGSTVVFDKYTERYCQSSCCDLARDIDILQAGMIGTGPTGNGGTLTENPITSPSNPKITECGDKLITLRTKFDCYDKFTGIFYGKPKDVLSGSATFTHQVVTNLRGRIVRRPREVKREYSFNCRLQRVESTAVYLLEGYEYFPTWKMQEIEAQLHSTEIYVEDVRYEFNGGTPFAQLHNCLEIFKLETFLNDCTVRQVFGCVGDCEEEQNYDGAMMMFVIPGEYAGMGFYNESKQFVASDYDELLNYFRNLNGMSAVSDIDVSSLGCNVYKAFSVSGSAYIPTSFYFDNANRSNRVYGTTFGSLEEICTLYSNTCVKPIVVLDDVVIGDQVCAAPDLGDVVIATMSGDDIPFAGYSDWEIIEPDTEAGVYNGQVTMTLHVSNPELPEDPSAPGEPVIIGGDLVAVIGAEGRPATHALLTEHNSSMTPGTTLIISANGLIRFYGPATSSDPSGSIIELNNLTYNIN